MRRTASSSASTAVGVLTLATLVSLSLLGTSSGVSAVSLASPSTQRVMLAGHEEEAAQWIASLTEAVRAFRGGASLPDHFASALNLPVNALAGLHALAGDRLPIQDRSLLPLSPPAHHLINLPPPAQA